MTLCDSLDELYQRNVIRAIDKQFAFFIAAQLGSEESPMIAWAALLSFELGKGNVCLALASLDKNALFDLPPAASAPFAALLEFDRAEEIFLSSPVVGDGQCPTPFVLAQSRLYLHRYWMAEKQVAQEIRKRAIDVPVCADAREILDRLFVPDIALLKKTFPSWDENARVQKLVDFFDVISENAIDLAALSSAIVRNESSENILALLPNAARLDGQKVAAAVALSYGFTVISGGPGTGKTTTVAKLLAALVSCNKNARALDIKLVAPTGKAANRLSESIGKAVKALPISAEICANIPVQASTIHRLLGAIPNRIEFRHHQGNRLHLDVLVVDEASMVDLPLMARLLLALPCHARVILLGDRDQLASVEAGAVLGDICAGVAKGFSARRAKSLSALTGFPLTGNSLVSGVSDGVCLLQKSYRFHANSGIGQLAYAINSGESWQLDKVLLRGFDDIALHDLDSDVYGLAITQAVEAYSQYLSAMHSGAESQRILQHFSSARVLCALSEGPFGVKGLNTAIEKALALKGLICVGEALFYPGRPVLVVKNDHGLGLYNGDIGIVVKHDDGLRVVFEMSDGLVKAFLPSRLPEHQTAYAMTIHKSQGSEFDHTLLVLPPRASSVMTRELVYTGITRAKNKLDLYATRMSLIRAMRRKTKRFSGLADALGVL